MTEWTMRELHVVDLKDGTYGVEISRPEGVPLVLSGYASETDADGFRRDEEEVHSSGRERGSHGSAEMTKRPATRSS
jgi:hypothetical protein